REAREETAWRFLPEALVGVYRWRVPANGTTYLRITFSGDCEDHRPDQPLDSGIIRTVWLSRDELQARDDLRSPLVLRSIDDYIGGRRYPLALLVDLVPGT
ncbi:MAG: NUDIX hydrolase, partial [Gammaproteobacteria bacterium]